MNRKDEHLSLAKAFHKEKTNDFDRIRFVHHSLPELSVDEVDISTSFLTFNLPQPFYVNAMTGGSQRAQEINQQLGILAKETGLLVATGSVSAALKDPSLAPTYQVLRQENPRGVIVANIGAGLGLEEAQRAIDLLQADALQIHLNLPQELVMPEGDCDFTNWLKSIEAIVAKIPVPVIVKEVGFGVSQETLAQLIAIGVTAVDVSGQGGTSFTQIENARRPKRELAFLDDWGQSTVISLLESLPWQKQLTVLGSGGIRNSLDIVKGLALGAKSMGVAGTILATLMKQDGLTASLALIQQWQAELRMLYTLLGKKTTAELTTTDLVLDPTLTNWCQSRKLPIASLATRSQLK